MTTLLHVPMPDAAPAPPSPPRPPKPAETPPPGADARKPLAPLIRRATRPDAPATERRRAFGEIVARFQDMAFGAAYAALGDAALAEDAAQEAFLAAWRHLDDLREPDAFPGWFQRIVRTQCNRLTRGKQLPCVSFDRIGDAPAGRGSDPSGRAEQNERIRLVREALAALPEHERAATLLYYLGDYSQAEIAAFLGVPVTTVKKRIFSARGRLREGMAPYMQTEPTPDSPARSAETLVRDALASSRPSNDPAFADAVRLRAAIEDGDLAAVLALLGEDGARAKTTDAHGMTPLHHAARFGRDAVAAALLAAGSDPNARAGEAARGATPLHALAAGSARVEIAERLLAAGADPDAPPGAGRTPVAVAARRAVPAAEDAADGFALAEFLLARGAKADVFTAVALDRGADMAALLAADPSAANRADGETGEMPLHVAARAGYRRAAKALLDAGADPSAADPEGRTPLHVAAQPGRTRRLPPHAPVVALLIERGATLDVFAAALVGDTARLAALLEEDPSRAAARDAAGATPLHHAAHQGHEAAVALLLSRGADPNAEDREGRTPLAVRWSGPDVSPAVADRLLAAGARPDLRVALALGREDDARALLRADPTLATPDLLDWCLANLSDARMIALPFETGATLDLHQAAALGARDAVVRLLDGDADAVRARDARRRTALHHAAARGHEDAARLLLDRGALVGAADAGGTTPLHFAVANGHADLLALLLERGADAAQPDHRGESPLFAACRRGDRDGAARLLAAGAPVNAAGAGRTTPLHLAAESGAEPLVALLLDAGADREARNFWGGGPLHLAAREGHLGVARRLLAAGSVPVARDGWHRTPLHVAVWAGQAEMASLLLDAGVGVGELSFGYSTPLHVAAERGHVAVGERLVARGADVNARSDFGRTPLHDAVHGGHLEMARFLLDRGADASAPNNRGMTPLHWAAASGAADIARLLRDAGADPAARSHKGETPCDIALRHGHAEAASLLQ